MMDNWTGVMIFLIPIVAIIGGITMGVVNSINRSRVRELEIRERIAMIERGLVPAPETDPRGFDRAMGSREALHDEDDDRDDYRYSGWGPLGRYRRSGITLMGVGGGLMVLLYPNYRVGAFLIVMGVAMVIATLIDSPRPKRRSPSRGSRPPSERDS